MEAIIYDYFVSGFFKVVLCSVPHIVLFCFVTTPYWYGMISCIATSYINLWENFLFVSLTIISGSLNILAHVLYINFHMVFDYLFINYFSI